MVGSHGYKALRPPLIVIPQNLYTVATDGIHGQNYLIDTMEGNTITITNEEGLLTASKSVLPGDITAIKLHRTQIAKKYCRCQTN